MRTHYLERINAKGQPGVFVCSHCGLQGGIGLMNTPCTGLTAGDQEDDVLDAIDPEVE